MEKGKLRVLYVDDEPINRMLFRLNLQKFFDITLSDSGEEGLSTLEREKSIDFIVSDFKMPGLNGVEFIQKVKEKFGNIPSIILSAYSENEIISKAIEEGIVLRLIEKPMTQSNMVETIQMYAKSS